MESTVFRPCFPNTSVDMAMMPCPHFFIYLASSIDMARHTRQTVPATKIPVTLHYQNADKHSCRALPSRLCKQHSCTPQNTAIFGNSPNRPFSALVSRHAPTTFAAQCSEAKKLTKTAGCRKALNGSCLRRESLLPPFCLPSASLLPLIAS